TSCAPASAEARSRRRPVRGSLGRDFFCALSEDDLASGNLELRSQRMPMARGDAGDATPGQLNGTECRNTNERERIGCLLAVNHLGGTPRSRSLFGSITRQQSGGAHGVRRTKQPVGAHLYVSRERRRASICD